MNRCSSPDRVSSRAHASADGSVIVTVDHRRKGGLHGTQHQCNRATGLSGPQPRSIIYSWRRTAVAYWCRAGVWLNLLTVAPGGVTQQVTRRLDYPPTAVAYANADMLAQVMTRPYASQPVVREINLTLPAAEPFENSLEQFVPMVETQLSLTLNDWGDPQPTQ